MNDKPLLNRQPEPEPMDIETEAVAYAVADFNEVNAAFVERLLARIGPCDAALAVDLGTGPGDIPLRLVSQRPDWHVVAVDVSGPMLACARQAADQTGLDVVPDWVQVDAKRLPFRSGTFDVVFSNSILHHITDTAPFWAEVKRIAKPGAYAMLRDLARPDSEDAAAAIVEKYSGNESALLKEEFYRSLLSSYTPGEVRAQLDQAGLACLHVEMVSDRHHDVFGRIAA